MFTTLTGGRIIHKLYWHHYWVPAVRTAQFTISRRALVRFTSPELSGTLGLLWFRVYEQRLDVTVDVDTGSRCLTPSLTAAIRSIEAGLWDMKRGAVRTKAPCARCDVQV